MEVLERIWEVVSGIINAILGRFERAITVLFGSANARFLRRLQPKVDAINALEAEIKARGVFFLALDTLGDGHDPHAARDLNQLPEHAPPHQRRRYARRIDHS